MKNMKPHEKINSIKKRSQDVIGECNQTYVHGKLLNFPEIFSN